MIVCRKHQRFLLVSAIAFVVSLLLACAGSVPAARSPRWACPSPTPLPYGEAGPVKDWNENTVIDPTTGIPATTRVPVYYEEWEREYGPGGTLLNGSPPLSGPPFPAPTPYSVQGTSYTLGQRVEIWPMHVMVEARSDQIVDLPGVAPNSQRLYHVEITWYNHSAEAIPINYGQSVRVRSVTAPNGAIVTDSIWGMSNTSLQVDGGSPPPIEIPPGESHVSIPIIAPVEQIKTVEIVFQGMPGYNPLLPSPTTLSGTPTPVSPSAFPTATPTPNSDLRNTDPTYLTVQWTDTEFKIGPRCGERGAMTDWDGSGWGHEAAIAIAAPPGASRVVQIALNQVGKRYVWGSKGPETFDCSGLMTWSYARIGINIPQGTAGQWPRLRPVSAAEVQPGDLIFFTVESPGRIDHVGMLIGDQNGDGKWDMVHASAPCCGVRVEYDVFNRPFWRDKIAGFRTAR